MSAFDSHIQKFVSDFAHIGSILCIVPKKRKEKHDQSVRFTVRIDRVWSAALEPVLEVDFLSFSYYYVIGTFSF
mgnify:CR=1 FL=1